MTRRNLLKTLFGAIFAGRIALECGAKTPKLVEKLGDAGADGPIGAPGIDGMDGNTGPVGQPGFQTNPAWVNAPYECFIVGGPWLIEKVGTVTNNDKGPVISNWTFGSHPTGREYTVADLRKIAIRA